MRFIRNLDSVRPIENVRKVVLPSGLRIVAEEVPQVRSITVGAWVLTGSRDEPEERAGISHFIEHMLFKGTRRRSALAIAKQSEAIGGHIDAFTARENSCYYARVFEEHLPKAVSILGDILAAPLFAREEVERERRVVYEEIESYENNPEEMAHDLITELIWPAHPLGRPILGTRETLAKIGSRALTAYHREHYTAGNIVIAASGNLEFDRLVDLVRRHVPLRPEPAPDGHYPLTRFRSRTRQCERDITQVSLALAGRGPSYHGADRFTLSVLNMILGAGISSRLFRKIREDEGLAYTVYSFLDQMRDTGIFGIFLGVAPENTRRALALACREIRKLKRDGIRPWELESAKAQLLMSHFLGFESTYERMNRIALSEIGYGRQASLERLLQKIHEISADEVQEAIERYLQPDRFCLLTLGPKKGDYPGSGDWDF